MIFEIIGFVLSSLIAGFFLLFKYTGDVYPRFIKRILYSQAIKKWQAGLEQKLHVYNNLYPTKTADTGIIVAPQDTLLESPRNVNSNYEADDLLFYGVDDAENGLVIKITRFSENVAEALIYLNFRGRRFTATCTGKSASVDAVEFSVGNLKLEIVQGMRTWRLWFNGIMSDADNEGTQVHTSFNVLWKPLEWPTDSQKNANSALLSEQMASNTKCGQSLFDLENLLPHGYSQFGTFHGQIKLNDPSSSSVVTEKEEQIYFYGFKVRQFLNLSSKAPVLAHKGWGHEQLEVFAWSGATGQAFRLSSNNGIWVDGVTAHSSNQTYSVTAVDTLPENFKSVHALPKFFTLKDSSRTHQIEVWPRFLQKALPNFEVNQLTLTLDGKKSHGIVLRMLDRNVISESVKDKQAEYRLQNQERKVTSCHEDSLQDFLSLDSTACLNVKFVGGKAASLAALQQFSAKENELSGDGEFKTAEGFCATTSFFRRSLNLTEFTKNFSNVTSDSELQQACNDVQNLILNSGKEDEISQLVSVWINRTFVKCKDGKFLNMKAERFAVRSSGTLEDTADISCAGQNDTFLGVKEEKVARKIIECWASLFSSQSVRYRLNHGQPAVSDMGVVVQAMVNATAAGVIFTADPITGNPFEMLVNANYGLGESVVSATCDPDTIKILRSRDTRETLSIGSKIIGQKKLKIVVNEQGTGSTQEVILNEIESNSCCVPDEVALTLGRVALQLVAVNDGRPLDIEWAIDANNLYILQSRNITSLDSWTDFEIIHEHDTPLRTPFERLTTANTGEVMPGATSTLALSLIVRSLDVAIQSLHCDRSGEIPNPYISKSCAIARSRLLLNVLQTLYRNNEPEIQPVSLAIDLTIFGHGVLDEELHELAIQRWGVDSNGKKVKSLLSMVWLLITMNRTVKKATKRFSNYVLDFNDVAQDPKALYERITHSVFDAIEICKYHCSMSEASSGSQIFAFLFLSEGRKACDWDTALYNDVSKILSVCQDVESADIPSAMDKLAQIVIDQGDEVVASLTTGQTPDQALAVILKNPTLSEALDEFLGKHGHRGVFELDLMRQSWKTEPTALILLLQSIVNSKTKFKDSWKSTEAQSQVSNNDEALLDSLQSSMKSHTRTLLKYILPYCRNSVWNREKTKSLAVAVINQLKLAFNQLSTLMAREQLISDAKLIYHFTHDEIQQLLARSPNSSRILYKAMRRQKLHNLLESEEFEELMVGVPEPTDKSIPIEVGDSITATPVSTGRIQGTVKVCTSVEEASQLIQPGDILVTHSTDIGWSPFFPILGGVVTELGGLISHGAVVAREYGLPCIVGATHATKIFKTGDHAVLDASKGTLFKVETPPAVSPTKTSDSPKILIPGNR